MLMVGGKVNTYGDLKAFGESIRPGGGETQVPIYPKC